MIRYIYSVEHIDGSYQHCLCKALSPNTEDQYFSVDDIQFYKILSSDTAIETSVKDYTKHTERSNKVELDEHIRRLESIYGH